MTNVADMATTLTESGMAYQPNQWEEVPCPFCNHNRNSVHEKYGPNHCYTYVQCSECDLVYANPRPVYNQEFVEIAYEEYDVANHHFQFGELNNGEREVVDRYKITLRQIEAHLGRKGKLLDIGCSSGLFLKAALEEGWSGEGIDISQTMTKKVSEWLTVPTYCGQYHEIKPIQNGKFDVIYCSHVIEHIPNPNEWLKKFYLDLKSDGILCLNIPNQFSLDRRLKRGLKKLGLKKDKWEVWRTPDHLFEPHLGPMEWLLRKHKFSILESFTYSRKETSEKKWTNKLFHHQLKWGSKARLLARPSSPSLSA